MRKQINLDFVFFKGMWTDQGIQDSLTQHGMRIAVKPTEILSVKYSETVLDTCTGEKRISSRNIDRQKKPKRVNTTREITFLSGRLR